MWSSTKYLYEFNTVYIASNKIVIKSDNAELPANQFAI